jgi:hypothetical protein
VIGKQVLCLIDNFHKECVGGNWEVSFHMVQVIHREYEHHCLLNTLNAKVSPIVLLKTILFKAYLFNSAILVMDLSRSIDDKVFRAKIL